MIMTLENTKEQIESVLNTAIATQPNSQDDPNFIEAYMTAEGQIDGVIDPLNESNDGLNESITAQELLAEEIDELIEEIDELQSDLNERSEERRVGKECRCGRERYEEKKNVTHEK